MLSSRSDILAYYSLAKNFVLAESVSHFSDGEGDSDWPTVGYYITRAEVEQLTHNPSGMNATARVGH